METIPVKFNLTRQDARALAHADSLCFDHLKDGTGEIRAIQRADRSSTGFEQTHHIKAYQSTVENYGKAVYAQWVGFHMEMNVKVSKTMQTLIRRQLREGSAFALRWVRDNSSPVLIEAGVVRDELRLDVYRGRHVDRYLIAVQVGYDNTARMIRGAH